MNLEKELQLVTFEQERLLRKLGFDYSPISHKPTVALALQYLEDVMGVYGCVMYVWSGEDITFMINFTAKGLGIRIGDNTEYKTRREADSVLLTLILKYLIKQKRGE